VWDSGFIVVAGKVQRVVWCHHFYLFPAQRKAGYLKMYGGLRLVKSAFCLTLEDFYPGIAFTTGRKGVCFYPAVGNE
jgi:hypothetical protein